MKIDLTDPLPQTSGAIHLKGLQADVAVVRDRWGIPHIRAHSTADAFFAQGFVHAQDRMWHMEWDRRRAYGRTAALIGLPGVDADRLARRFQIERAAKADWDLLNMETRAMLESYAAGVNAFLERTPVPSVEFKILDMRPEAWRVWDSLSVFKIRHVLMGVLYAKVWRFKLVLQLGPERAAALFPDYADGHPLIIPPDEIYHRAVEGAVGSGVELPTQQRLPSQHLLEKAAALLPSGDGSNNWVVDGTKTKSGKPLLAGDPHRAIDVPNVYYQNHLASDEWDVMGVSFPGVPAFPHLGHNERVAWAITHAGADYQDLYLERFDPNHLDRYEYKGTWQSVEVSEEQIRVRGGEPTTERVRRTQHGPIVEDSPWPNYRIAMRYTGFEPGKTFECFLLMMRARSVEELREAQREWVDPVQNLIMADALGERGNIGYQTRGRLPIRSEANGWLPVPGWSGEHEWQGYIPFDEMPHAMNPPSHFISTANNKIVGDDYPYFISADYAPGFRATRINELLKPLTNATVDDFVKIQADRLSVLARALVPLLLAACSETRFTRENGFLSRALDPLRSWDYRLEPDSVATTIYATTRDALMQLLLEPILGRETTRQMFSLPRAGATPSEPFFTLGRGGSTHAARLRSNLPDFIQTNDTRLFDAHPIPLPRAGEGWGAGWPAAMQAALRIAVSTLRAKLGDDMSTWQWSRLHTTAPIHPLSVLPEVGSRLNPPRVPYGGDGDTVQAAAYYPATGYRIAGTQCYRQIIDLGNFSNSRWVVPLGASGHPGSPHFADQVETWRNNQHIPMLYDWEEIKAASSEVLRLKR